MKAKTSRTSSKPRSRGVAARGAAVQNKKNVRGRRMDICLGFRVPVWLANMSHPILLVFCFMAGIFSSTPMLWFETATMLVVATCGFTLLFCGLWEVLVEHVFSVPIGERLQSSKQEGPKYLQEAVGTASCMFVFATLVAWPVTQARRGDPTLFKATLVECVPEFARGDLAYGPELFYLGKTLAILFIADLHTFFKHYCLHSPALYAFHKPHHAFHNPSTFACFAIHPFEALWTFCPILLICCVDVCPGWDEVAGLYAPWHAPLLVSFGFLNMYLHCGYRVPLLEGTLPYLYLNTSVWHNKHHELSVAHFGEILTLWDHILGTHSESWDRQFYAQQSLSVAKGKSGMDDAMDTKIRKSTRREERVT